MTKQIIEKWYKKLGFKKEYDKEFYELLDTIEIPEDTCIKNYDTKCTDGKKNLLAFLYMCERTSGFYKEKGISEEILLDTLYDIVRWCDVWVGLKGELYLGEINWLAWHLRCDLFKLGRLQYGMEKSYFDVKSLGIKEGDPIIAIHIPRCGSLKKDELIASIKMADEFFPKYFTEHNYKYITCNSWLLDGMLKEILPADSGILTFADMFNKTYSEQSDDILSFVFGKTANRENLGEFEATTSLTVKIKEYIANGRNFCRTRGYIKRDSYK